MNLALIALVSAIITAVVTWSIAQRQIAVENVTKERAKWREQIRDLASQIYDALSSPIEDKKQIQKLTMRLTVLLDPHDKRDQQILNLLDDLNNITEKTKKDFIHGVALLLKHDWERSKLEAGFFLRRWILSVRRLEESDVGKCDGECCRKYKIKCVPLILVSVIGTVIVLATTVYITLIFADVIICC